MGVQGMRRLQGIGLLAGRKRGDGMVEKEAEFGVCDECGEYTEELMLMEGAWICKKCSHIF